MGNASGTPHDIESWNLADLFADGNTAVDSLKHESYSSDPQVLSRMLRTLQWPSGLLSTITLEMFHKILDQEVFFPILGQNLRSGGVSLLLRTISEILMVTGNRTWSEIMDPTMRSSGTQSMWEGSSPTSTEEATADTPMNIDAMFALAQFTFLLLTFLTNHLTLHELIMHVEYPVIPEVLLCSSSSETEAISPSVATTPMTSTDFLIFLGIPKAVLKHPPVEPSSPPSNAELAQWETVGIQLPLKNFGKLPPPERASHFVTPLKQALKSWLGNNFHNLIEDDRLRFATSSSASLLNLESLSAIVSTALLHTRVFNPQEPIISCVIIADLAPDPSGVLGQLTRSVLHFLTNSYQAFFFSDRLSPKACPIGTRIECHKSWLSSLLIIMSLRASHDDGRLSETSFASEIECLGKRFQSLDESRRAHLRSQLRIARVRLGMTSTAAVLPPISLYRSSCLESAALMNSSKLPKVGMDLVDAILREANLADETLYYLLNVYFLYVRGQSIPMVANEEDSAAADDPFRQLEEYFSVNVPTIVKRPSVATYGELYSYHKAIGYCVNWKSTSRDIAQLSPCLAFDFLPLSLRVTASAFFLLLCNQGGALEQALERFQATSMMTLVTAKKPTKLIFYKSIEDCFATMAISSRLRSQTGFAMFYTLATKNRLFGSAPLLSDKAPEIILSILELLVSIMISDNSRIDKASGQANLLTLHTSHPSIHMSLSLLLNLSSRESFGELLVKHILPNSPGWLFASSPSPEQTAAEQKRIARLQGRIKNMSLGHVLCQVCLRLMEWNLRIRKETSVSEYLIAILHNIKRFSQLDLHWSVCEMMVAHLEAGIKILLSRLASPHTLAEVSTTNNTPLSGFETLNPVDFVTNHLELLVSHIQALAQFVSYLILPENVRRNPLMLYTLVRHGSQPFEFIRELCDEVDTSNVLERGTEIAEMIESSTDLACLYIVKQLCVYRFIRYELLPTCIYLEDVVRLCALSRDSFESLCRSWRQVERIIDCQEKPSLIRSDSDRFRVSADEEPEAQSAKEDEQEEDDRTPEQIAAEFAKRREELATSKIIFPIETNAAFAHRLGAYQSALRVLNRATAHSVPLKETLQGLTLFVTWDVLYSYLLRPYMRTAGANGEIETSFSPQFKTPAIKRKDTLTHPVVESPPISLEAGTAVTAHYVV